MTYMRRVLTVVALGTSAGLGCARGDRQAADAGAAAAQTDMGPGISLEAEALKHGDISTAPLRRVSRPGEVALAGILVSDPERAMMVRAPIAGRLWEPDGARWPALGEHVDSGRVLGQVADARPMFASRGGTVTRVLAVPGEIVAASGELLEVSDVDHPLARITWTADGPLDAPTAVAISPAYRSDIAVPAELVGTAGAADASSIFPAYLYRAARAWPGARPGVAVIARFSDPRISGQGIFVPDEAVVQWNALPWIYVQVGKGRFAREPLETEHAVQGGYIVTKGLTERDTIVVRGAQLLLSEEFRATSAASSDEE